jgi:aminomethyltransferase
LEPQKTPLFDAHVRLGGKMADFAGWILPLWYPAGQVTEHHAVRKACGLFDICHMGEFKITGSGSGAFLAKALTGAVARMADGQAMYHFMLNAQGGVIDDCILYRFDQGDWMLVVNAGNIQIDFDWLTSRATPGVRVENISGKTVKLDLQGPKAPALMLKWMDRDQLLGLRFFRFIPRVRINGMDVLVSRTGYTGEIGFELYTDLKHAGDLWDLLLAEGKPYGLLPCGLGARDTLRLEAGLPLHGHELRPDRPALGHPWEFAISWEHDFIGREALDDCRKRGIQIHVRAFAMDGRRKAMPGWGVFTEGRKTGSVLSGVISPSLNNTPIGFLETDQSLDQNVSLSFAAESGAALEGKTTVSPFVPPTSRRPMGDFLSQIAR